MTKTERARVESFLRDLARVCVAHGVYVWTDRASLMGYTKHRFRLVIHPKKGEAHATLHDAPDDVITVKFDKTPPSF